MEKNFTIKQRMATPEESMNIDKMFMDVLNGDTGITQEKSHVETISELRKLVDDGELSKIELADLIRRAAKVEKDSAEAAKVLAERIVEDRTINDKLLDEVITYINEWHSVGVDVERSTVFRPYDSGSSGFKIRINDWTTSVEYSRRFVTMPTAYLGKAWTQVVTKYGRDLIKEIVTVLEEGGPFWDVISTEEVSKRGTRLVETLKKHGFSPAWKGCADFSTWKSNLPAGWLPCVIRTIMSGKTGNMRCMSCKYAVFTKGGYVRCMKETRWVDTGHGIPNWVMKAKTKKVYGNVLCTDIIEDVTADCNRCERVPKRELRARQAIYHRHEK